MTREEDLKAFLAFYKAGTARLQKKAKDVPGKMAGCLSLTPEKAKTLYALLYELLENQKQNKENNEK